MIDKAAILMKEGNLISSERICSTNDNMTTFHSHEYFEIYYLESGTRYHIIEGKIYTLAPGHIALFRPNQLHYSFSDKDVSFSRLLVYFDKSIIQNADIFNILSDICGVYQLSNKNNIEIYGFMKQILLEETVKDEYYEESMKNLVNQLLIQLIRNTSNKMVTYHKTLSSRVISYINKNYMNKITIGEIAEQFYISQWHLCREFKNDTNETIIQYTNKVRIVESQILLLETNKSITSISSEVGFENVTHFERVFKQIVGTTPSKYRKQTI